MTFWQRSKRCWQLLWHPEDFAHFDGWTRRIHALDALLDSPVYGYALKAVEKNAKDPSFHPTKDHEKKRREAFEWANTYAKEDGVRLHAWDVSFLIEWVIGERKGAL